MKFTPSIPDSTNKPAFAPWSPLLALPMLGVALLSFIPLHDKQKLHTKGHLHYIGHALAFGGLAFLLISAARTPRLRLLAFLVALAFGLLVEYEQHVRYREAVEWTDILIDSAAVLLASGFAALLALRRSRSPEHLPL